jgi:uncharacterized protein
MQYIKNQRGGAVVRPAPILTEDNQLFWDAAARGRLVAQRCGGCGRLRHPPRPVCPDCHSLEHEVIELAGTGRVYSYAVLHHPRNPRFSYPLVAVLVDLDEGVRLMSNLVGVEPAGVRIGMPVRVAFAPTADDLAVPVFEPLAVGR